MTPLPTVLKFKAKRFMNVLLHCPLRRLSCLLLSTQALLLLFGAPLTRAQTPRVVINEIMYQPASFSTNEEWIEIWNHDTNSVNLQGWRFTRGIDYTFSNTLTLSPGAY